MLVSPLFKLFKMMNSTHGSWEAYDMLTQAPTAGRNTVIDSGLGLCDGLIGAVKRGFIVHGFEPVPAHVEHCRRGLPAHSYYQVQLPHPSSPPSAWQQVHRQIPKPPDGRGFAYLYQAALGESNGFANMTVNLGWSTLLTKSRAGGQQSRSPIIQIQVVTLDDVLDPELAIWLLKMDLQGFELRALRSAQGLLRHRRIAHVQPEVVPYLLDSADPPNGTDGLLALLRAHDFLCFDWARTTHMPALPPAERPSSARGWVQAMRNHTKIGAGARRADHAANERAAAYGIPRKQISAEKSWRLIGSVDDLLCVHTFGGAEGAE